MMELIPPGAQAPSSAAVPGGGRAGTAGTPSLGSVGVDDMIFNWRGSDFVGNGGGR